ncbi:SDR family NAD(P)-dependent oxidoreductase [Rhodovastum atsumiense]|uniref:SDR family NAD(P)-dependent oxidoreductase n=1 Tax=Rhodovastum atsumiense TaxID=504468 RepID=A0A5M6IT38_9PROT|nr:SDR family NAD(P)-dependent oxidoreductase [Rhodovastum atsumiense]KAA5610605.1 SDR family NAD(P)-dependent oxidoreductase [Rhodovastum atsumiense]CAH2600723.1 SDR family NAD(P)-dependent oxidoreductase [Rhodovastum atsumiense]
MRIENRVFLVSGGASGLGAATVRALAAAGARVVIADLAREAGLALAAELGERARFVATDVTSAADGEAAVALARTAFGGLHGLVNCAGVAPSERVLGRAGPHGLDSFARTVAINLVGSFNMIRLAAALIAEGEPDEGGERGVIVNAASIAAFDGQVGQAAYAASKAGVVGLTLPVARELARVGIRVVTIAPGVFETPMMAAMPADVRESLGRTVPFPSRLGDPAEFAALVRHICENPMLNGSVIRLDGALRMPPR